MKNKLLLSILIILVVLLASIVCFANNDTNLGEELKNSTNKSEHTIQNAGEGIKNIASDIGNGIQNAANDIGKGVENVFHAGTTGNSPTTTSTDGYTAARTSTDSTATGMGGISRAVWIWLIMGIVGIIIIALTWYYVTQDSHSRK